MPASETKQDFHLEEFKALRAEILLLKQHQFSLQKWVVVTLGILYGLAFGVTGDGTIRLLPAINKHLLFVAAAGFSYMCAFMYGITDFTFSTLSGYIREIEVFVAGNEAPKGWEHLQISRADKYSLWNVLSRDYRPVWGIVRNPFWWAVLGVSSGILIFDYCGMI